MKKSHALLDRLAAGKAGSPSRFIRAMSHPPGSDVLVISGLLLLGVLLYLGILWSDPVWDDHRYVFSSAFLMRCGNLLDVLDPRNLFYVLPVKNSARPVWLASVLLDTCLYEGQPSGYRLTSVLCHASGGALTLALAWRLTRDRWIAALTGLLFVAHPLHTEPVNIVTFRAGPLAYVLMAASLLAYLIGRDGRGRRGGVWVSVSLALYPAAMLAKESAVVLPALIVLADRLFPPPRRALLGGSRRLAVYAAFGLLLLGYLVFRTPRAGYVISDHADFFTDVRERVDWLKAPVTPGREAPPEKGGRTARPPWSRAYSDPGARLWTMSAVHGSYLRLLLWPHPLRGDYSPPVVETWRDGRVLASWLGWLALLAVGWRLRRRHPAAAFGLFWIPLTLLPVSGVFAIANLQAERYLYMPSAGLCLAAAVAVRALSRQRERGTRGAAAALAAALVLSYACLTVLRNADYRDEKAYYEATLIVDPEVARARFNLAGVCQLRGETAEAEAAYREALRRWPGFLRGRVVFALFLMGQDRIDEGIEELREALRSAPEEEAGPALFHLVLAHRRAGHDEEARRMLEMLRRVDPGLAADLERTGP